MKVISKSDIQHKERKLRFKVRVRRHEFDANVESEVNDTIIFMINFYT